MNSFLIPFVAFVAVILIMLLAYGVWSHFFDRRKKAKKQRLQTIHKTVFWGRQSPSIAQAALEDNALVTWLRARSRTFKRLEDLCRRANSPLTAGRLIGLMLALFTVVVMFGLLRQTNPLLLLMLAITTASMPVLWLSRQSNLRSKAFEDKLPEMLDYISRAVRAGHSLTSALNMVGKELPGPIGQEFKTVSDELNFGISFNNTLGRLADRVKSSDLNFFVIALMIQHETGGNLSELLDGLAKTIRERFKLRGKIRTLSSEGRASAWVLGSMPFAFAGIIMLINPDYISVLWTTPQGQILILICGGLMVVGTVMLNQIIQIKV